MEVVDQALEHRLGTPSSAFRRSFRRNLRALLTHLNISVEKALIRKIIDSRNKLVHTGRFVTPAEPPTYCSWSQEYTRLLWLDRCILLRFVNPTAALPSIEG